ncbi:unnamed protein product [Fraxinus pennsylvanica]|uniref:C2 domain-containing protein n=1 Tax=Fraxinus pennsylvanica TaxID=56036 RepID=A0AAD1ZHJ0_9LAMI|nr:unnamed protein product [Fraxinus pennsylvanica]
MYISDQRPTAKKLWKPPVRILEVGILGAQGLLPMKMKDGRGTTDAYCVAKYGQKWARTRTILDNFSPKWNEQYTWEVYDPWVKIMGDLQLAIRFTSLSLANTIYVFGHPLLPKMHYLHPFTANQVDNLRYQAMNIVAVRLGRPEPPLKKRPHDAVRMSYDRLRSVAVVLYATPFRVVAFVAGLYILRHPRLKIEHWCTKATDQIAGSSWDELQYTTSCSFFW